MEIRYKINASAEFEKGINIDPKFKYKKPTVKAPKNKSL
jgi:hypothetical protein